MGKILNRKPSPNTEWLENPYGWAGYVSVLVLARIVFAYLPFISSDLAWTLTNVSHNLVRCSPSLVPRLLCASLPFPMAFFILYWSNTQSCARLPSQPSTL